MPRGAGYGADTLKAVRRAVAREVSEGYQFVDLCLDDGDLVGSFRYFDDPNVYAVRPRVEGCRARNLADAVWLELIEEIDIGGVERSWRRRRGEHVELDWTGVTHNPPYHLSSVDPDEEGPLWWLDQHRIPTELLRKRAQQNRLITAVMASIQNYEYRPVAILLLVQPDQVGSAPIVEGLYVNPDHRGQGIGSSLVHSALHAGARSGAHEVVSDVDTTLVRTSASSPARTLRAPVT